MIEIETEESTETGMSAWWRATNVGERIAFARHDAHRTWQVDPNLAARRLAQWRALPAFVDDAYLDRRLQAAGIDREQFERILGATPPDFAAQSDGNSAPPWASDLDRILADRQYTTDAPQSDRRADLTDGLAPFLRAAETKLLSEVDRRGFNPPVQREGLRAIFMPALLSRFVSVISRTMVLEVNVARLRGELAGDTPDERFRHFCVLLKRPDYLRTILEEYAVLTRCLVTMADQWVVHTAEILERLAGDWDALRGTLLPPDTSHLVSVVGDAGDTHRDGRAVTILSFDNGAKVVYKPRPLSIDAHYNALLQWLNDRGLTPHLEGVEVLDRESYGWARYVEAAGCADDAALRRFYQRQGALLALLYALDATDVHLENVIAAGEHPMLIDLESLFQHRLNALATSGSADAAFMRSVMRIGLLPQRLWTFDDREVGMDISGLAGAGGQLTPFEIPTLENFGTDEVKVVRKRLRFPGASNLPTVNGQSPRVEDHADDIVAGFQSMYRLLVEQRDALLADAGPLTAFAQDEVRTVLRGTRVYGMVLGEATHPDFLRDGIDRSRLFERMWDRGRFSEQWFAIVPAEIRQLERGDVPMFISRAACRDLWSSDGEFFPDYFDEDSYSAVRNRIGTLDEADLQRQTWFIKASIASLTLGVFVPTVQHPTAAATGDLTPEGLAAAVHAVADRIESLALRGTEVTWIGLSLLGARQWTLRPLAYDLYSGVLGPMLFLACAGDRLQTDRYTTLARQTFDGLVRNVAVLRDATATEAVSPPGGYSGPGSIVHALTLIGALWKDDQALAAAEQLLPLVSRFIPGDDSYDVIGGSAGVILNVLSLWRATGSARALEVAREAGNYVLSKAERVSAGIVWRNRLEQSQPLAGFSHGASGIAHALLLLARATGDDRYFTAARGALEYERSVYSPEHRNWPDFRTDDVPAADRDSLRFMTAWCHGAPGIGLARLTAAQIMDEAWIHDDIDVAVETTFAAFGTNDSICHGDLGNAEFLNAVARMRRDTVLQQRVEEKVAPIAIRIASGTWYCGTPLGTETPGLMTGLAGIGYGLLRFLDPDLPSLLTLTAAVTERSTAAGQ